MISGDRADDADLQHRHAEAERDGTFRRRKAVLSRFLPGLVLIVAGALTLGYFQRELLVQSLADKEKTDVRLASDALAGELARPITLLHSLAEEEDSVRQVIDAVGRPDPAGMINAFRSLATRNPDYAQVRWIGEDGMERVRVDRLADGRIRVVPNDELQNKRDRYYFTDTLRLAPGKYFVSPLDLNVEHGRIDVPYNPMIRFATRVYTRDAKPNGILILNLSARRMLDKFARAGSDSPDFALLNGDGYWLSASHAEDEWGFMFGHKETFGSRHPRAWQRIAASAHGQEQLAGGLWTWSTVRFGDGDQVANAILWKVVAHIPPAELAARRDRIWLPLGAGALALTAMLAVISWRMAREQESRLAAELALVTRETAAAYVAKSLAQAKVFIAQAPISIAMFDRDMRYLAYSERWLKEYGRGQADLTGRSHYEIHPDIPDQWKRVHQRGLAGETIKNDEDVWVQADGARFWLRWAVLPWTEADGAIGGIIISAEDITERMRALEEIQRLNAELEQRVQDRTAELAAANRELARNNKELDEFAYIASHDLKEPLRGIHNYASFLAEDYGDKLDDEGRMYLERMQRLAERETDLLDRLLAYSRIGFGELPAEAVDLERLLDNVAEDLAAFLADHKIELRRRDRLPTVIGNATRIGEVFQNLIVNAAKYNDKTEKWVEIGCDQSAAGPVFHVRDNGIGIAPQHQESIFRIFKRLHEQNKFGGGTGAGLTIVKKIIERHGGRIWLDSTPAVGTTFHFTLSAEAS